MADEPTVLQLRFLGEPMGVLGYRPNGPSFALEIATSFLAAGHDISPLNMPIASFAGGPRFFQTGDSPFAGGLPGFIADSLPDAWGEKMLRFSHPEIVTILGKLAAIGERGPGAISFEPALDAPSTGTPHGENLAELATRANALRTEPVPLTTNRINDILARASSSLGGAYPKTNAHLRLDSEFLDRREILIDGPTPRGYVPCILKFARSNDEAEGAVEYAFSQMAKNAGIRVPRTALVSDGTTRHFATERFDRYLRTDNSLGRRHVHSLSGMLHRRASDGSIDYEDLMRLSRTLCGANEASECFRRITFNLLATNRDDHGRNHAFLYDDKARTWTLAPAFDLNPSVGNRLVALSFSGSQELPTKFDALAHLAEIGGIPPKKAREVYDKVEAATIGGWREVATRASVPEAMIRYWSLEMESQTKALRQDAGRLLQGRRNALVSDQGAPSASRRGDTGISGRAGRSSEMTGVDDDQDGRSNGPAAAAIVDKLSALRGRWAKADLADREELTRRALEIVNDTTGSGITKIPLCVAARDFVEGKADLDLLKKRVNDHVGARTVGQVLGKRQLPGLER